MSLRPNMKPPTAQELLYIRRQKAKATRRKKPLTPEQIRLRKNILRESGKTSIYPHTIASDSVIHLGQKPDATQPQRPWGSAKKRGESTAKKPGTSPQRSKVSMVEREQKKSLFTKTLNWGRRVIGRKPKVPYVLKVAPKKAVPKTVGDSLKTLQAVEKYAKRIENKKKAAGEDPTKMRLSSKDVRRLIELKETELALAEVEKEIDFVGRQLSRGRFNKTRYKKTRKKRQRTSLKDRLKIIWTADRPLVGPTFRLFRLFGKTDFPEAKKNIGELTALRNREVKKFEDTMNETNTKRIMGVYQKMRSEGEANVLSKVKSDLRTPKGQKEYQKARRETVTEQLAAVRDKGTKKTKVQANPSGFQKKRAPIIRIMPRDKIGKTALLGEARKLTRGLKTRNGPESIARAAGFFELVNFHIKQGTLTQMTPTEKIGLRSNLRIIINNPDVINLIKPNTYLLSQYLKAERWLDQTAREALRPEHLQRKAS